MRKNAVFRDACHGNSASRPAVLALRLVPRHAVSAPLDSGESDLWRSPIRHSLVCCQRVAPPAFEPLPLGTILDGRYRLKDQIGEGGMGRVYHGEDMRLGRHR